MSDFDGVEIFIPLTQGKITVIDFADREGIVEHKWNAQRMSNGSFYAVRTSPKDSVTGKRKRISIHREIMKPGFGQRVDHKFGNTLDNRRSELRFATRAENRRAFCKPKENMSSRFRGVTWSKRDKKWLTRIQKEGLSIYLGHFESEEGAARAYDKAALEHFGEFAQPNFP